MAVNWLWSFAISILVWTRRAASKLDNLDKGPFGWPYNPTGIELAYVGKVFSLGEEYVQKWLSMQYKKTYDSVSDDLMTKGSPDITTSSARIYEAVRIADNSL